MSVRLRPGGAVHVVDEGLLFCGWMSSGLVECKPGVVRVWQAVEPLLRQGVDPQLLRERLPAQGLPALDVLLAELDTHMMLTTAELSDLSAAQTHLAHFAPDVDAACAAVKATSIGLVGREDLTGPLAKMLADAGLSTVPATEQGAFVAFAGDLAAFVAAGDVAARRGRRTVAASSSPRVVAVACGPRILVADCTAGTDRLMRALLSLTSPAGGDDAPVELCPTAVAWSIALTLIVERVFRAMAGLADGSAATIVENASASSVRLPAAPRPAAPMAWSEVAPVLSTPTSEQIEAVAVTHEFRIVLDGPDPGDLDQIPVARQRVRLAGTSYAGAGLDQQRAGADALLAATRAYLRQVGAPHDDGHGDSHGDERSEARGRAQNRSNDEAPGRVASFAAAGRGGVDLLADAVGRALVELADPLALPVDVLKLADPLATRWSQVVQRLSGVPARLRVGPAPHCPTVVLASATTGVHTAWGYGSNVDQALEHALRGLLKRTLINDENQADAKWDDLVATPDGVDRVAVAHEVAVGEAMLRGLLDQPDDPIVVADQIAQVVRCIPGFDAQPWDLGDEFGLAGVLGAMVRVGR